MVNGTGRQPTVPKRNADDPDHTSYGHRIPSGGSAGEMKGNHGSGYHTTSVGASTATPLELTPRQLTLLDLAAK